MSSLDLIIQYTGKIIVCSRVTRRYFLYFSRNRAQRKGNVISFDLVVHHFHLTKMINYPKKKLYVVVVATQYVCDSTYVVRARADKFFSSTTQLS